MRQRLIILLIVGLLLAIALIGAPQTNQVPMNWQGLEEAWKEYFPNPSEAGAEKILNLLPNNVKIADNHDGSAVVDSFNEHLGILEGEIYSGNPNAIKLVFRLFTISSGTFEIALNKITGNLIAFSPKLFLEELVAHRDLFPSLNPILGSFLNENPDDPAARTQEKKLRINALETVEDKALKSIRNECIKILKRL